MPDPPLRQIFLPNYKINISVPAGFTDDQIADAIQRNKALIQQASPVFAQGQQYIRNGLGADNAGNGLQVPAMGITEQQARQQGVPNAAANAVIAANQSRDAQNLALQGRISSLSNMQSLMQRGQLPTDYDATYLDQKANLANVAKQLADLNAQQQRLGSLTPIDQLNRMVGAGARSLLPGLLSTDPVMEQKLNALPSLGAMASASPPGGYGETMIPGVEKQLYDTPGYWGGLQRGAYAAAAPTNLGLMAALPVTGMGSALAPLFAAQNVYGAASALFDMDTLNNRGLGAYLGQATVPLAFAGLGAYGLARGLGSGGDPVQDGVNAADPSAPPLLPPGPDPNVYEAEFRPNTPTAPAPSDLALASGRPSSLPQITSGFPAEEGFGADSTGNRVRTTLGALVRRSSGPEMPTAYGQELIPLPTEQGLSRYSSPADYGALDTETQNGGLVRYRPSVPMLPDSAIPLSSSSPALSSASPTVVLPPDPPSIPLTITSGETQALSALLGEQHPFAMAMDPFLADGRTTAMISVTAPQLAALRSLAEQTTNVSDSGPDSYNRATFLKRINATSQSFPATSGTGALLPQISGAVTALGQLINSPTTQGNPVRRDFIGGRQTGSFSMTPEEIDALPLPRVNVEETLAHGQLSVSWFKRYQKYAFYEYPYYPSSLEDVFQGETLERARHAFKDFPQVLQSPIILREDIKENGKLGTIGRDSTSPSGYAIGINGRIYVDPEDMISLLAEEAEHISQQLHGMVFYTHDSTGKEIPYEDRPHEKLAKAVAFQISGRPELSYQPVTTRLAKP